MDTADVVYAFLTMVIGLVAVIFGGRLARHTADFYYRVTRVRYSERQYRVMYIGVGILFFVYGMLTAIRELAPSS